MSVSLPTFANSNWCEFVNKHSGEATILLYGNIGTWDGIVEAEFIAALKDLEHDNPKIRVHLNTGGGDVFGGNSIFNNFQDSTSEITIVVDGIAASMGSVVLQGASKGRRMMHKNAKLMMHRITGGASGDADKMRETAALMEDLEQDIATIYAEGKGETVQWVMDNWLVSGKDFWMNAKEALANGLIDEIVNDKSITAPPRNIHNNPTALWNFYNKQLITVEGSTTTPKGMERELMAIKLGLSKDATWDQINAKLDEMQAADNSEELNKLKAEVKTSKDAKIKGLLDKNKLTGDKRASYEKLADADFDSTVEILEGLVVTPKPTDLIDPAGDPAGKSVDRDKWTFRDWQQNDATGLNKMRLEDEDKYEGLKSSFDPKNPTGIVKQA